MSSTGTRSDFLAEMARTSRERAAHLSLAELERRTRSLPAPPRLVLSPLGFDLIAEIKFVSPAAGALADDAGAEVAAARARDYAAAGACAISVLTEPTRFGGALEHLTHAAETARVPVMRKDFLVAPEQVFEARLAGAAGVLLVLRMLDDASLAAMLAAARACRVFVLLEAFDEADLARAAAVVESPARPELLVGVNARDLATLAVVPERLLALAPRLPRRAPCVAESGIATAADARAAAAAGYSLALVGSALMRAPDPGALANELIAAGRAARRTP